MKKHLASALAVIAAACMTPPVPAYPEGRPIDAPKSSLRIHVSKSGVFAAFAHDHDVDAPIQSGEVNMAEAPSVDIRVDARKLRVLDPGESEGNRAQIQKTMEGSQVLDADRYPEIRFHSTKVEPMGADHWLVTGDLELHGQTHPVTVDVTLKDGSYRGSATLKQTAFGITPVKIAGGSVKVKDELKIEFQVALGQ